MSTFSQRHRFEQPDAPITIRSEAPDWLRSLVVRLAYDAGLGPSTLREMLCELLLESPDPSNWSEYPNVDNEVRGLISQAEWCVFAISSKCCANVFVLLAEFGAMA